MIYVVVILCIVIVSISVRYLHMEEEMDHLEEDNKDLQFELDRSIEDIEHLNSQMKVTEQYHERRAIIRERILNQSIDNAIKRNRSVYYVPRLNEIIEYKELEELGEL